MKHNLGWSLYERAKKIIPGGTQLFGKRGELFLPDFWPCYYKIAKGVSLTTVDDQCLLDFTMVGIGANVLGYADDLVTLAVSRAQSNGNLSTLNCPEEVELAESLVQRHPWSEMVRFCRSGGEAVAMAVRIARVASGRTGVAFCGYHGWHDWYLSANLSGSEELRTHLLPGLDPTGVPEGLKSTIFPFEYNSIESFCQVMDAHNPGVIVLEPYRYNGPAEGFLETICSLARAKGAVVIFDEITSGYREYPGGRHMLSQISPDVLVLGKSMSNGVPMAAILGIRSVMESAMDTFISSTYWTDRSGPAAALATLDKFSSSGVAERLLSVGERLEKILKSASCDSNVQIAIASLGTTMEFRFTEDQSERTMTYFTQEMLKKGFLATNRVYANFCHADQYLDEYSDALSEVFHDISETEKKGDVLALDGAERKTSFGRV